MKPFPLNETQNKAVGWTRPMVESWHLLSIPTPTQDVKTQQEGGCSQPGGHFAPSLQSWGKMNFCGLSRTAYGILLRQPKQAKTKISMLRNRAPL